MLIVPYFRNPLKNQEPFTPIGGDKRPWLAGESGIRTHGDISATFDFESSALDQLSHLSEKYGGIVPCGGADVKFNA